jgi:predicted oxidoreductase
MIREDFITFIEQLGFEQTWQSNPNYYILYTDKIGIGLSNNQLSRFDMLGVTLNDELGIAQLTLSQMSSNMSAGKNFGNFSLKTFGQKDDFQLEIFMSFITGSFNKLPNTITKYMRDMKIKNILND